MNQLSLTDIEISIGIGSFKYGIVIFEMKKTIGSLFLSVLCLLAKRTRHLPSSAKPPAARPPTSWCIATLVLRWFASVIISEHHVSIFLQAAQ